jgi:hypothetical protein
MPIPAVVATIPAAAPDKVAAPAADKTGSVETPAPPEHGWVVRTAAVAAEDIVQLFAGLGFKTADPSPGEMRGPQQ